MNDNQIKDELNEEDLDLGFDDEDLTDTSDEDKDEGDIEFDYDEEGNIVIPDDSEDGDSENIHFFGKTDHCSGSGEGYCSDKLENEQKIFGHRLSPYWFLSFSTRAFIAFARWLILFLISGSSSAVVQPYSGR